MPELPEVETTVRDLRTKVLRRTFVDAWTDFKKMIKKPKDFQAFKKEIINKKIKKVRRRAKFILFGLSGDKTLLIHQKLTGHLLLGKWKRKDNKWIASAYPLSEKINTYIHLLFTLDNGEMLALSDSRKFAKVELWDADQLAESEEMKSLGPEPLEKDFTFEKFKEILKGKKGKIKQALMNQKVIAGIGNIYAAEILFRAKANPLRSADSLKLAEVREIYSAIKETLREGIECRGSSVDTYRDAYGKKGNFAQRLQVYRRAGQPCFKCGTPIKKVDLGGRGTYFCPKCQKAKKTLSSSSPAQAAAKGKEEIYLFNSLP